MDVFEQYFDKMVEGSLWKSILLKEAMSSTSLEVLGVCGLERGEQKTGCCQVASQNNEFGHMTANELSSSKDSGS